MVNYLIDKELKLPVAIHRAGLLDPLLEILKRRLAEADKGLRVQKGETLFQSQGRAQELDALIEALTLKRSD